LHSFLINLEQAYTNWVFLFVPADTLATFR
jgi:hypothetical protein